MGRTRGVRDKRKSKLAKAVVRGAPVKIRGLAEGPDGQLLVLMNWTTGDCYVPFQLAKKHFPRMMLDHLLAAPVDLGADEEEDEEAGDGPAETANRLNSSGASEL